MTHNHAGNNRVENLLKNKKRLTLVLGVTLVFFVVEAVGGFLSNSLALISDAGHMIMDAAAIILSLFAVQLSMRPPSPQNTFSFVRIEIIAAFVNGITLVGLAFYIFYEAFQRIEEPPEIKVGIMLSVAVIGMAANVVSAWILWGASHDNLNVKGAYLHVMGDLAASVGTVLAGVVVYWTGWTIMDPVISIFIGVLIIRSSWSLLRDSIHVLMEGTPRHLDVSGIIERIKSVEGVHAVHDFHIWSLTTDTALLTAHVGIKDRAQGVSILENITVILEKEYGLQHVTIQIEDTASGFCKVSC
ncbi:MAG: cation transporter [bacterium]|nr:MAG: cation transporter [bacterium]